MVLAGVVVWGEKGVGGGGGVKRTHSISRCGTYNCAVLYWSKGLVLYKERRDVSLLSLVLFWLFVL